MIQRALQLEPDLSEAYASLGLWGEDAWDFAAAGAALRQTIALFVLRRAGLLEEAIRPAPLAHANSSWSRLWLDLGLGRHPESLDLIDHLDVDDLSVAWWGDLFDPVRNDPRFRTFLEKRRLTAIHERALQTRARLGVGPKP